ncbi:molybdopterin-binding protein [Pseudarthrobacter sp. NamE5]|uniref:molybdopterin-binding protein n=1 Tax=Pseudarthrobacter sp. NamE5 TaxID=2576839 RepID=UPI001F1055CC|nr:molybdopterin-binding protein [Pseudarthrobacter sp. NamE5]
MAVAVGYDHLEVQAKPAVAVILTGSKVAAHGVPPPGTVRDALEPQLATVISLLRGTPGPSRRIGDSLAKCVTALDETSAVGSSSADVVITTGGTGKSGTDHFREAVSRLGGRLLVYGIAMRPGHPAVLAKRPKPETGPGPPRSITAATTSKRMSKRPRTSADAGFAPGQGALCLSVESS